MHQRNVSGIKESAQKKRLATIARAEEGIKKLLREGRHVSFAAVAETANVSTAWLYQQPEMVERINHLRGQKPQQQVPSNQRASDASKDAMIAALRQQVKELRVENEALGKQIEVAYGIAYGQQGTSLAEENKRLSEEVERLKAMLDQSVKAHQDEVEKTKKLRAKNTELKGQLIGMKALEVERDELKHEKQRLFNKVTQLESAERAKAKRGFAKAISDQPNIPEVKF